jgi:hypothetical protein
MELELDMLGVARKLVKNVVLPKQQMIEFWFQRILGIHVYNRRCYFYLFNL